MASRTEVPQQAAAARVAAVTPSHANAIRVLVILAVVLLVEVLVVIGSSSPWLAPQPILSTAAVIVGIVVLSWQLDRQHEHTLRANRASARDRLHLDVYQQIARSIEAALAPLAELATTAAAIVTTLRLDRRTEHRMADLMALSGRVSSAMAALIGVLQMYELVMPEFVLFRRRLPALHARVRGVFGEFSVQAGPFLAGAFVGDPPARRPSDEELQRLATLADHIQPAAATLSASVCDLRVAAQDQLLGRLFPGRRLADATLGDVAAEGTAVAQPTSRSAALRK